MEKYENIMKLVDSKLAEQESIIEYYRKEKEKWEERENELNLKILQLDGERCNLESQYEALVEESKRMDAVISDLKKTIEQLKQQLNDF